VAHKLSWFSTDHVGVLLPKIKKKSPKYQRTVGYPSTSWASCMILHCDDGIRHVEAVLEEPLYWVYLRTLSLEWNPHCKQFLPWSKFGAWRPFEDIKEEEPTDNIEYIISRYFRYNIIDPPLIVIVKCLCLLQDNKYSSFYGLLCFFAKKYWPFGFLLSIYWKFCR